MDHSHSQSASTPWNVHLGYAVAWSIVLVVPVVLLSARHLGRLFVLRASAIRNRRRTHTLRSDGNAGIPQHELDCHGGPLPQQRSSSKRWAFSRLENWITNKASATLYLGPFLQFVAGATLIGLIFLGVLAVLTLNNVDLMLNSNRAGYLGLACIPFLLAFTGKNSFISSLTGIPHHRLNQVHRFLGVCLFILISVHMGCMFHVWWPWKKLLADQLATPKVRYGLTTYTALGLILLLSSWPVRRWAYEVFVVSHSLLFLIFLVTVSLHTPYAMRFTVAGIVLYLLNVLTGWCIRTELAIAQATGFQNRLTRVQIQSRFRPAPGQHIYICVPSISLIQWHPFTVTTVAAIQRQRHGEAPMTIHSRVVGGFTKALNRWPENTQRRVIVSGPYGKPIRVGLGADCAKIVFVAAGSGLAYIVPILQDLIQTRQRWQKSWYRTDADDDGDGENDDESGKGAAQIEVVWCIRDPGEVQWFQEELEIILDMANGHLDVEKDKEDMGLIKADTQATPLRVIIHFTKSGYGDEESVTVPASAVNTGENIEGESGLKAAITPNGPFAGDTRVTWIGSRLDTSAYLRRQIDETPKDGVLEVVGCGPPQMLAQLHNAVAAGEHLSRCCVNLHTERFSM